MARLKDYLQIYIGLMLSLVNAYDLSGFNYTMEDLAKYQKEMEREGNVGVVEVQGRWLSNPTGSCKCDLTDEEAYCKCCAGFSWRGTPHEGCIKTGIEFSPVLAAVLTLNYDDWRWSIRFEPEICFPLAWFGLIKICLSLYHTHFCRDPNDIWMSALTACIQLDIVILFAILTIDFNCLALKNGKLTIDDSYRTDKGGFIVYKLGHGFVRSSTATTLIVGKFPKESIAETAYKRCTQEGDFTVVCKAKTARIKGRKRRMIY